MISKAAGGGAQDHIVASRRLQVIISLPHTETEQNETQKNKVDGKSNITVFADKMKLGSLD